MFPQTSFVRAAESASPGLDYCSTARINLSSVIIDAAWSQHEGQKTHNILLMLHRLGEAGD